MKILPVVGNQKDAKIFWEKLQEIGVEEEYVHPEKILVLGGDGTLLGAQRKYYAMQKPFIGVGFGSVNFLLNRSLTDPKLFYEKLVADQWTTFTTCGMHAEIHTNEGKYEGIAFNDVYVKAMDPTGIVGLTLNTAEYRDLAVSGDGLIVASPQGSTAYNRTAGGTILPLGSTLWGLTGICTQKPLRVTVAQQEVHMRITRGEALLVTDNKVFRNVRDVVISPSAQCAQVSFDQNENFEQRRYNEL